MCTSPGDTGLDQAWKTLHSLESAANNFYHRAYAYCASCAFKCAFCEYPVNQGPLTLPIEIVEKELREIQAVSEIRSLIFTDDTFNVPLGVSKDLLRILAKYDFE